MQGDVLLWIREVHLQGLYQPGDPGSVSDSGAQLRWQWSSSPVQCSGLISGVLQWPGLTRHCLTPGSQVNQSEVRIRGFSQSEVRIPGGEDTVLVCHGDWCWWSREWVGQVCCRVQGWSCRFISACSTQICSSQTRHHRGRTGRPDTTLWWTSINYNEMKINDDSNILSFFMW